MNLKRLIDDNMERLLQALHKDLHKVIEPANLYSLFRCKYIRAQNNAAKRPEPVTTLQLSMN